MKNIFLIIIMFSFISITGCTSDSEEADQNINYVSALMTSSILNYDWDQDEYDAMLSCKEVQKEHNKLIESKGIHSEDNKDKLEKFSRLYKIYNKFCLKVESKESKSNILDSVDEYLNIYDEIEEDLRTHWVLFFM